MKHIGSDEQIPVSDFDFHIGFELHNPLSTFIDSMLNKFNSINDLYFRLKFHKAIDCK